jgi:predicted metal-dependent enzyme (double-stranded beta helix superfamily)
MSAVLLDLPVLQPSACSLPTLIEALDAAVCGADPASEQLPEAVRQELARHADIALRLSAAQWAGDPHRYTRHLLHADPAGRYAVMALIWHPGQRTPIHGHHTWCAYLVLQGVLREERFVWEPERECARQTDSVTRLAGQTLAAPAGLAAIHSLGNDSRELAVSIHVYGVSGEQIATHVNHLVQGERS